LPCGLVACFSGLLDSAGVAGHPEFAGASWPYAGEPALAPVVAICGDNEAALGQARSLIASLGGEAAVTGGLASARQLEDAAGFVMRVVAARANPRRAVPGVDPAALGQLQPAEARASCSPS
jgi:8-hydroxy-5-deazaflavin:NADPH oxidoreductase